MLKVDKKIYLDYAGAAPTDPRVAKLVYDISKKYGGNPSSAHSFGQEAKNILELARKSIARNLSVKQAEVFFVGSGTESVNLAILGTARANKKYGRHIVTTNIEHYAVLRACRQLEKEEFKITYIPAEKNGIIDPNRVLAAIKPETILVSVQHANNEIGTIQPIREITGGIKKLKTRNYKLKTIFHTDACQTAGFLNVKPAHLGVDMLSFNGSKIYGPKGAGVLYKKSSVQLEPLFHGGSQERGLRAGTENVALAVGLALALEIAEKEKDKESKRLTKLRDWFIQKILSEIPGSSLNGDLKLRLPNNINISFKGIDGEILMAALDRQGIAVSTGSACTTSETGQSHVLKAINNRKDSGNLRISMGRFTTKEELSRTLKILKKEVGKIRRI